MRRDYKLISIFFLILLSISLSTNFMGSTDVAEYAGAAKFFAGKYKADIRASHSMFYGFVHAPLVRLFQNFGVMKLINVVVLLLIVISVYCISGKNKKTLLLVLTAPVVWYMAPWINPIQIAGLLFLWAFFFILKFDKRGSIWSLAYSGVFAGVSIAFWNTSLYIVVILAVTFLYNKKVNYSLFFFSFVLVGLLPLFFFEQIFFGFFLFSISKTFLSNLIAFFYGSIYPGAESLRGTSFFDFFPFLLMTPFLSYVLLYRKNFKGHERAIIFLVLSFLFLLLNPQIRYLIFLYPIVILYLGRSLTAKHFKIQLFIFVIISLLVISPYLVQIKYDTNSPELISLIRNFGNWSISSANEKNLISEDLQDISVEYPNEVFLVGPDKNDYSTLALIYWGDDIEEFVSIEDYNLFLRGENVLFKKKLESKSRINNRRQIWIEGGISKNPGDETYYESIKHAISINGALDLENFELLKEFKVLKLYALEVPPK